MNKFMRLCQIYAFFICLLVGVHSNGNGIRVAISSDWDCCMEYKKLVAPKLSEEAPNQAIVQPIYEKYKKQRFRVEIYKAGVPFPFGGYAMGEFKGSDDEQDTFSFAKIPDNWIEEKGKEAQGQGVVLEILLPPILQVQNSKGEMEVYRPRIRRPFHIVRDSMDRVYVFSIRPNELSVRRMPEIVAVNSPSNTVEAFQERVRRGRKLVELAKQRTAQAIYEFKLGEMLALTKHYRAIAAFNKPLDEDIAHEKVVESNELLTKIETLYKELVAEEVVLFKERYNTVQKAATGGLQNPQDSANPNVNLSLSSIGKAPVLQSQTQQQKLTAERQNIQGIQVPAMSDIIQNVLHQWFATRKRKRPQKADPSSNYPQTAEGGKKPKRNAGTIIVF